MALNSKSSDEQVWDAYDDSASYEELGSVPAAKTFITASLILLRRRPKRFRTEGIGETEFDPELISRELDNARKWVSVRDTTDERHSVRHLDISGFRD